MISSSLINKHHAFDTHSFANSLTFSKTALLIFSFNSDGAADSVMGFGGFYLMKNFLAERGYCKNKLKLPLEASLKKRHHSMLIKVAITCPRESVRCSKKLIGTRGFFDSLTHS